MAIVVESVSATGSATSSSSLIIDKPTGLQVGELMVAKLGGHNAGGVESDTYNTLAGWSVASSTNFNNRVTHSIQYKIATSADVAATDFTFTTTSTLGYAVGVILRCSGNNTVDGGFGVAATDTNSLSATFTGTITPAYTPPKDGSLVIIMAGEYRNAGGFTTIGGYDTVTSGISFTETYISQVTGSNRGSTTAAYGIQTSAAELSSFINTYTGNVGTQQYGTFAVFNPPVDATGTNILETSTGATFTQTGTCDTIGGNILAEATATMFEQNGQATSPTQWTNEDKPSTTWVNESL